MEDVKKTKSQLIAELAELRQRITELGATEDKRKLAEEELRSTRDYLNNLLESSLDAMVVSDEKGHITWANRAFFDILGYEEEELLGKHISETSVTKEGTYESTTGELIKINKDFIHNSISLTSKLLEEGKISNWETYCVRRNKKLIPIEKNSVILYGENGYLSGTLSIIRDITENKRKANETREAREARDFLENVFKTSVDGIIISSKSLIIMVNEAIEKMLGYSKDELIGKYIMELYTAS